MMPRRAICAGFSPVMSAPLKWMLPRVGLRNWVSRLKQVVLPAPLGPISAWMLPRRTFRDTSCTATKPLNSLVKPRVSSMTSSDKLLLPRRRALLYKGGHALPALLVREARGDDLARKRVGAREIHVHLQVERAPAGRRRRGRL